MPTVGDMIKKYRLEKGLTQKELGELCGMADSAVRRYENGRSNPTLETVKRFADALNVFITDLVNENVEYDRPDSPTPSDELILLQNYRTLNAMGKHEARKRTEELTKIPEYQKDPGSESK